MFSLGLPRRNIPRTANHQLSSVEICSPYLGGIPMTCGRDSGDRSYPHLLGEVLLDFGGYVLFWSLNPISVQGSRTFLNPKKRPFSQARSCGKARQPGRWLVTRYPASGSASAIVNSSIVRPAESASASHRGRFPRPDQCSEGWSGFRYFGKTFGYFRGR